MGFEVEVEGFHADEEYSVGICGKICRQLEECGRHEGIKAMVSVMSCLGASLAWWSLGCGGGGQA